MWQSVALVKFYYMTIVVLSSPLLAPLRSCGSRGLGVNGLALPVRRGHWRGRTGRLDVDFSVLDRIYDAPAVGSDTRVEAHVDVSLADIASEDECGAGLLGGGVALAQNEQQNADVDKLDGREEGSIGLQ